MFVHRLAFECISESEPTLPRLRKLLPNVPVMRSTGQADLDAQTLATSHALVTLLPKPFTAAALSQKVDSIAKRAGH